MTQSAHPGTKGSIRNQLMVGVLLLALVPLLLVSITGYQIASNSLRDSALQDLMESSRDNQRFIKNWFDYRFMDIERLSTDTATTELMETLSEDFFAADESLPDYIRSYDWEALVAKHRSNLFNQWLAYDYIYDIFLIDIDGNVLMSLARESDLGTNLYTGPYGETLFADVVRNTLEQGRTLMSDFERYAPSNDLLSAFISAPVLDDHGLRIGAVAMQVRLDRVQVALRMAHGGWSSNYLVGTDGLLRTAIQDEASEVLIRKIDSPLFHQWLANLEQGSAVYTEPRIEVGYSGPDGNPVIGVAVPLKVGNLEWLLVSEKDQKVALSAASQLAEVTMILLIATGFIVLLVTYRLSEKLTEPILRLKEVSRQAASGSLDQTIDVRANNEIGELAKIFQTMLDARRNHEEKLLESSRRLEQVVDATSVGIWDWNIESGHFDINGRWAEMLGYDLDELTPMSDERWRSMVHLGDLRRSDQALDDYFSGEKSYYECEFRMRHKDGGWVWIYDTGKIIARDGRGEPTRMIGTHSEVTRRKQEEFELIKAKEAAEAGAKAKSEFLASMSHEIRTPMNGVLGMLGLLSRSELAPVQKHQVKLAVTSAESLLGLINDILDFSKIEAGKLDIESVDFDLVHMLGDFIEFEAQKSQQKGVEVVLDMTGIEQSMVKGDPGRLRQVLSNLLGNAAKFTEQGEIVVRASLEDHGDNGLLFYCSVTDTGIGIPEDKLKTIFGSFSQVDSSTTRRYGGTGLGLSIAKQLCLLMGGDIEVSSTEGKGSAFSFNIVLEHSNEKKLVVPEVDVTGLPILVVDDNSTNRYVLRTQLEIWGAEVTEAESAAQALALMTERIDNKLPGFAVAFLDMQMPDVDGLELGRDIRKDKRFDAVPMVMMSSMANRGDQNLFSEAGFNAYFPKPTTLSDLYAALALVLTQKCEAGDKPKLLTAENIDRDSLPQVLEIKQSSHWPEHSRVLVVEDNHINQVVVKGVFDELGLPSDMADNGVKALQALREAGSERPYSIIFMDCQMPEMDGYATTRAIRRGEAGDFYRNVPIVAMTANAMKGDREKCLEAGMDDYLSKPIDHIDVEARVEHWLLGVNAEQKTNNKIEETDNTGGKSMSEQEIWDQERALARVKGKPERLTILVEMFLKNIPPLMEELTAALSQGDLVVVSEKAHAIKGVAANLSVNHLMTLAAEVELQAKDGSLDGVQVLMAPLAKTFDESLAALRHYL
ncbi:MAG: hypothetical protein AseanaTS_01160 [Candidatus Pelagadaptatus aseana]|uniref:hybrid sensor histidine kinase/response regulator n=1 Tax=Candidatus Pelagadaptatus aseana TaxID=3120508 RepID=UPI0039B1D4AA